MTNQNGPTGFRVSDTSPDPKIKRFYIDGNVATAIFKGDLVNMVTDSSTSSEYPTVDVMAAASDNYLGAVVGIFNSDQVELSYLPASTAGYVDATTAPDAELVTQSEDGGTELTQAAVGDQADPIFGAGSTATGQSGLELSETLAGAGNSAQFTILDKVQRDNNNWGEHNIDLLVVAAEHALKSKRVAI